ncbi:MAG: hypothetical protein ACXITV_12600 [Luteibaculaceae bacterium]
MNRFIQHSLFFLVLCNALCLFSACRQDNLEVDIIADMHTKWQSNWPKNMQFEQYVYFFENDSMVRTEIWQEVLHSPQNLHIRFNGFETGSGMLFTNDSIFTFKNFTLVNAQKKVHQLLLLGFDVYHQSPNVTNQKLLELGFSLKESHQFVFEGDTIVVVGTNQKDDVESNQFWINKQQLYLERIILTNNNSKSDITFENYQWIENYPVATALTFKVNDKLIMREEYFNISFPAEVNENLFKPSKFNTLTWQSPCS